MDTQEVNSVAVYTMAIFFDNTLIHTCLASEKSANKTLEQGCLWYVHSHTHRVLPFEPHIKIKNITLQKEASLQWYCAHASNNPFLDKSIQKQESVSLQTETNKTIAHNGNKNNFLHALYDLVAQRKKDLPEGSYTTHLFTAGDNKIRKKLAEEAVEVILSQSRKEMIEEVSDLLYHTLVLLANNNISIDDCIAVLELRHKQ